MAKKIFLVVFAMIVFCLCCGICFAADNSVNLGNEIMQSINKTGESMNNVVSGNWTNKDVKDDRNNGERAVRNAENYVRDGAKTVTGTENYNTTRTTAGQTTNRAINTMSTTTWMWIILVVAAIIIIAAIWYYATQNND